MDARRQRFITGLLLIAGALVLNAFADYRLILANPDELEQAARRTLAAIFPDYHPKMDAPEFRLTDRRVILREVHFLEKGGTGRELFSVDSIEVEFTLVPPVVSRVVVINPTASLRIDKDGNLNFDTPTGGSGEKPTLLGDLHISVRGGRLRIKNELDGQDSDLYLRDLKAEVDLTPELVARGEGHARFGALFPQGDARAEGGYAITDDPEVAPALRWKPIFPLIDFDLDRSADGRVRAEVGLKQVDISPQLKSIIPPLFQKEIWEELDPAGFVDVRARVGVAEEGVRVGVTIVPDPVRSPQVRPRGFPTDIDRIAKGRFEVNVFLPKGATRPALLNVSWEGVEGRVGEGIVRSRGSVFPGAPEEHTSLFLAIEAEGLVLDRALQNALPPDIRKVYDEFSPQGRVRRANVIIFKGPHETEPQLSVHVGELAGEISASFADYPIRLQEVRGTFDIREGANVRVRAQGKFQHGGDVVVAADVLAGDLIHVDVRAAGVPIGPELIAGLSPRVRETVEKFHPTAGTADVHVSVTKAHEDALAEPVIVVVLRDVVTRPEPFPLEITASGRLTITPRFPAGARAADAPDPDRVEVELDITSAYGPGLDGATAKGRLVIVPDGDDDFEGDIRATVASLQLGPELRAALPPELEGVWQQLAPEGAVKDAQVRLWTLERFEAKGRGEGMVVRPARFPWRLGVDSFEVARDGRTVRIVDARGTTSTGTITSIDRGRWTARGVVVDTGPGGEPALDLEATATDARLGPDLVAALPAGPPRDLLGSMRPEGRFDAAVSVRAMPGATPRVEGDVDLRGVRLEVDRLDEALSGLKDEPVTDLAGRVHLEVPERVEVQGLRGRLAGALVAAAGRIVAAEDADAARLRGASAALGGLTAVAGGRAEAGALTDLTVHVGGFVLDERTKAFAGPLAKDLLAEFRPRGPLDLQARLRRPLLGKTRVDLRIRPRGMSAVPDLMPLQVEALEGEVVVEDGEPVRVDLEGLLGDPTTIARGQPGPARVTIRRDRAREGAFPGGGSRGRVFELIVVGFERPTDPRARAELERDLPPEKLRLLTTFAPEGPIDAHAFIYRPDDERLPMRWVAELRPGPAREGEPRRGFSVRAGLLFEDIRGVVRVQGTVPELARGSCEGEVDLEQVDLKEQTARGVRGRFWLEDGVFSFGRPGMPVTGELWGGKVKVATEYVILDDRYRGWVAVEEARLARTVEELRELQTEDERGEGGGSRGGPVVGRVNAQLTFSGGGRGLDLRELPFRGSAWLKVEDTNLLPVYGLGWTSTIADALQGQYSRQLTFDTMYVEADLRPEVLNRPGVDLRRVELEATSAGLKLTNVGGTMTYDGDISLQLAPFDAGSGWLQKVLQNVPLVGGFTVRGKVTDPIVVPTLFPLTVVENAFENALGRGGE